MELYAPSSLMSERQGGWKLDSYRRHWLSHLVTLITPIYAGKGCKRPGPDTWDQDYTTLS